MMHGCMQRQPRLATLQVNTLASNPHDVLLNAKVIGKAEQSFKVHKYITCLNREGMLL